MHRMLCNETWSNATWSNTQRVKRTKPKKSGLQAGLWRLVLFFAAAACALAFSSHPAQADQLTVTNTASSGGAIENQDFYDLVVDLSSDTYAV